MTDIKILDFAAAREERDAPLPFENIVATLRELADDIESGESRVAPTAAIVVLFEQFPHRRDGPDEKVFSHRLSVHGLGPKEHGPVYYAGLLAMATAELTHVRVEGEL